MGIISTLVRPIARQITNKINKEAQQALVLQQNTLTNLIAMAKNTVFGKEHNFKEIKTHQDFVKNVPIRDYEQFRPYVGRIIKGEKDILWPDQPLYFAKTSGTTSGVKYIPISKQSIGHHFTTARNSVMTHLAVTKDANIFGGKVMFLSGSPILSKTSGILTGRLSGIVNHHIPSYLRFNRMPNYTTNCIEDWETKVDQIVEETYKKDMRLIGGIPPWVQMYFDRLVAKTGKPIKDIFPNLSILVHGGVNFKPYRAKLTATIGKEIATIETYPASEGFIAYQNSPFEEGLLLNVNAGLFFEFVPAQEIFQANPTRLSLADVELGVNYAILLTTNAGLWSYNIGDTVKFVSKNPYKIVVTGRIKHFISAFGEHVISEEVEEAMLSVAKQNGLKIVEFTVAPKIQTVNELPYHEWFVEFDEVPSDLSEVAKQIDVVLQQKNIYYADLIQGNILQTLKITPLQKGSFQRYMKSIGKLGGQNKVPRLANNRDMASQLEVFADIRRKT